MVFIKADQIWVVSCIMIWVSCVIRSFLFNLYFYVYILREQYKLIILCHTIKFSAPLQYGVSKKKFKLKQIFTHLCFSPIRPYYKIEIWGVNFREHYLLILASRTMQQWHIMVVYMQYIRDMTWFCKNFLNILRFTSLLNRVHISSTTIRAAQKNTFSEKSCSP